MSRLLYSNVNTGIVGAPVTSGYVAGNTVVAGGNIVYGQPATTVVQAPGVVQERVVQEVINQPAVVQEKVVQEVVQAPVVQEVVQQQVVSQPAVTQVVQQPVVQQVVQQVPQSQGPIQTTVQQGATQLGESRFEYIPKEKVWVEYEAVQTSEQVPKEVKLTDHYAVEHITEYVPKTYNDTFVDYYPVERLQERVEYQQAVKKLTHPMVQSEITETILPAIPGPQTLIESTSQIVETGRTEVLQGVNYGTTVVPAQTVVGATSVVGAPVASVVGAPVASVGGVVGATQVVGAPVVNAGVVGSRIVQAPAVQTVSAGLVGAPVASRVVPTTYAPNIVNSRVVLK